MRIIWSFFDGLGVAGEKVDSKGTADGEELPGVDGGLVEYLLKGARGDADLVCEPLVGVARAAEFVADKVAYVYLHSGCCCALGYRIPIYAPTTTNKKKASNLVSCLRSWKLPLRIDKMLACRRAFAHCLPQKDLFEVFHVSDRSGQ